jgi:two-component system sensor histidine kinase/response regulator
VTGRSTSPLGALLLQVGGLDVASALDRFDGMEDLLERMLVRFRDDHVGFVPRVRALLAAGQREDATRTVHSLKGVAGNLALTPVFESAARLESALSKGDPAESALLDDFEAKLEAALSALRAVPLNPAPTS